MSLLRIH